jgi:solute carrier family 50 protein (sugar transporter)
MAGMVAGALVVFGTIAIASFCAVHDHRHKKVLLGTSGMVATVILYASPLSVIVSFTPLYFYFHNYTSGGIKNLKRINSFQLPLFLLILCLSLYSDW